jgi:hypothetical protein
MSGPSAAAPAIPQSPAFTKSVELANDPAKGLSIGLSISEKLAFWGMVRCSALTLPSPASC